MWTLLTLWGCGCHGYSVLSTFHNSWYMPGEESATCGCMYRWYCAVLQQSVHASPRTLTMACHRWISLQAHTVRTKEQSFGKSRIAVCFLFCHQGKSHDMKTNLQLHYPKLLLFTTYFSENSSIQRNCRLNSQDLLNDKYCLLITNSQNVHNIYLFRAQSHECLLRSTVCPIKVSRAYSLVIN